MFLRNSMTTGSVQFKLNLKCYINVGDGIDGIGSYFTLYNTDRPHQSHGCRIPQEVYFERLKNEWPFVGSVGKNITGNINQIARIGNNLNIVAG